jgi:hypothetical protein
VLPNDAWIVRQSSGVEVRRNMSAMLLLFPVNSLVLPTKTSIVRKTALFTRP